MKITILILVIALLLFSLFIINVQKEYIEPYYTDWKGTELREDVIKEKIRKVMNDYEPNLHQLLEENGCNQAYYDKNDLPFIDEDEINLETGEIWQKWRLIECNHIFDAYYDKIKGFGVIDSIKCDCTVEMCKRIKGWETDLGYKEDDKECYKRLYDQDDTFYLKYPLK